MYVPDQMDKNSFINCNDDKKHQINIDDDKKKSGILGSSKMP